MVNIQLRNHTNFASVKGKGIWHFQQLIIDQITSNVSMVKGIKLTI